MIQNFHIFVTNYILLNKILIQEIFIPENEKYWKYINSNLILIYKGLRRNKILKLIILYRRERVQISNLYFELVFAFKECKQMQLC